MRHCVVVGAGISGLAAAWHLSSHHPEVRVTVLESADRVGGKIAADPVGDFGPVDTGAESVLARRPEALELIEQVGLGPDIVHPAVSTASIWSRGSLRAMPARTLLGIPSDPHTLAGLLEEAEVERVRHEVLSPPPGEGGGRSVDPPVADISIGDLVAARLGDAVVDRLVEPLLGGVYAGHARNLSAATALPAAFAAHRDGQSLVKVAAQAIPAASTSNGVARPVFAGIRGGIHRLPDTLATRLGERGVDLRTGTVVRALQRRGTGFRLECGPVPEPEQVDADLVVLATPAAATARILGRLAPDAADALSTIEVASLAIVTLVVPSRLVGRLPGSGILVPPVEGLTVKAATFSSNKWGWVAEAGVGRGEEAADLTVLRASIGRQGETRALRHSDEELITIVLDDLRRMGVDLPEPHDVYAWHVKRWGGGLPQYAVGHQQLMARVAEAMTAVPGLALCGAAYQGVGIPACIASGRAAATRVAASH